LEAGSDGRVSAVKLADGSTIEADTVIVVAQLHFFLSQMMQIQQL